MHKATLPSAAAVALAAGLLATSTTPAMACSADMQFVGSVCIMAEDYCPQNFVAANGQLLNIQQNTALFSLVGTTFGGDGKTTFGVPDLRGRMAYGIGNASASNPPLPNVNLGQAMGAEQVTLNSTQMPLHTHAATFAPVAGAGVTATPTFQAQGGPGTNLTAATGNYLAGATGGKLYAGTSSNPVQVQGLAATVTGTLTNPVATNGNAGANAPVTVTPPQQAMTFCINTVGVYPPRPY